MDKKIFEGIVKGAKEAAAYSRGEHVPGIRVHHLDVPEHVDVKAVRKRIGMTQRDFSKTFGFSVDAIKSWEQGRRQPEAAARVLLRVIEKFPDKVIEANC